VIGLTLQEKLDKHTSPEPNTGCWLWSGHVSGYGYAMVHVWDRVEKKTKTMYPHRILYERANGIYSKWPSSGSFVSRKVLR
jgi:hypothetical protein